MQIASRDYWFKVVEMLQQNWALIEPAERGVTVFFLQDASGVVRSTGVYVGAGSGGGSAEQQGCYI